MNIRKIKLALTVGLMNTPSGNALHQIKDLMTSFSQEVGQFLTLQQVNYAQLNHNHEQYRYALRFERLTVDLDLISNPNTKTQVIQRFELR
ncbi:MAG: hypothetical protein HRU40_03990 [Saprospiraceae bacterium]|jgi:hypothetical protein|nr:hypothetical protein [Saprospiraceae bacterium]